MTCTHSGIKWLKFDHVHAMHNVIKIYVCKQLQPNFSWSFCGNFRLVFSINIRILAHRIKNLFDKLYIIHIRLATMQYPITTLLPFTHHTGISISVKCFHIHFWNCKRWQKTKVKISVNNNHSYLFRYLWLMTRTITTTSKQQ